MEIFTIGFTQKSAPQFFGTLKRAGIKRLLDVRLNNSSQLAGYTKREDLPYFLDALCGAEYQHDLSLAPTEDLLKSYRKKVIDWNEYERRFLELMAERRIEQVVDRGLFETPTALLCSEPTAEHCHRRLVVEYLRDKWGDIRIVHL